MPALAILTLLGALLNDAANAKRWVESRAMLTLGNVPDDEQVRREHDRLEYPPYCLEIVRLRHVIPADDRPGDFIRMQRDGGRAQRGGAEIRNHEIASVYYLALLAG